MRPHHLLLACALASPAYISGCSSTGIALREQLGIPKRQQIVDRVTEARDSQDKAKVQFQSALDEFLSVTGASADKGVGDLESKYRKLKSQLDSAKSRADDVHSRIGSVERVSTALFKEWRAELAQYQNPDLRRQSEQQLDETVRQYDKLLGVMKNAESKMPPVLAAFNDHVLFLKHNLNAQAIASLQGTSQKIQSDVSALVRDMESSIAEANAFIEQMKQK
jgi:chromosome segregation ATPase